MCSDGGGEVSQVLGSGGTNKQYVFCIQKILSQPVLNIFLLEQEEGRTECHLRSSERYVLSLDDFFPNENT